MFSSIDERGRYAYGNQPPITLWNLTRLAEAMLPLLGQDQDAAVALAQEALGRFSGHFQPLLLDRFRRKLGIGTAGEDDAALVRDLLETMQRGQADFTLTFRRLAEDAALAQGGACRELFREPEAFDAWDSRWRQRLRSEEASGAERRDAMLRVNPLFIPRNHRVEAALEAAVERGDFGPFETLLSVLAKPFDDQPEHQDYALPPQPQERVLATFCGT